MLFHVYNPHANQNVTKDYVKLIEESLKKAGHETKMVSALQKAKQNKEIGIVVIQTSSENEAIRAGYKKIIRWVQGAGEAESFMRHHSWLRYYVLSLRNWRAFKKASFIVWCSETMKKYYEKRFKTEYKYHYIMPCFNDEIKKDAFFTKDKYKNNVFVYAGSLDTWQCFEPTVALYRGVEKRVDNSLFRVLVKDHEKATEILKKYGVEHYSLDFVPKEQVAEEMARAKFGFCIREDSIVNRVATPTKLSNYISNGVMPIYSEYIDSFHEIAGDCEYCFCANPSDFGEAVDRLVDMCEQTVCAEDVYTDYVKIFGDYYSREYHVERLAEQFKNIDKFI